MTDVYDYLLSKDLELHPAPNLNVRTSCFFHEEEGPAHEGRLYIKVDPDAEVPGLFFCHRCEAKGSLNRIKYHFGDKVDDEDIFKGRKIQVYNEACDYYFNKLDKDALSYLMDGRGLSLELIEQNKLGVAKEGLNSHLLSLNFTIDEIQSTGLVWDTGKDFFNDGTIIIPYFDQGECVQLRGRDRKAKKNKYKTPPGQAGLLFNTDTLHDAEEVIITEGEFDALVLEDLGYNAVGVPGSRAFKGEWGRFFSEARRVYVAFDNDDAGREGSESVASHLGAKARIVEMPRHEPGKPKVDITHYFIEQGNRKEDFDHLLRISSTGVLIRVEDAFSAWLDREGNPNLKGLQLGYETLDKIIAPGMLQGQVGIFLARTGSGKTVMMINFMQRIIMANPKTNILFVSLEQTRNEWYERARRIHGFYNDRLLPETTLNTATIDYYKDNLMMVDKNRLTLDELRVCIRQTEDELGAKLDLVVVDYLGYWSRGFKGEPYVRTSDAVMALKEVAKDAEVVIISPHQVNRGSAPGTNIKVSDARESGVVEETADFLLSIMNADATPGVSTGSYTGDVKMIILKSRHGGLGAEIDIKFAPTSLAMVPANDNLFDPKYLQRALDEINWRNAGEYVYSKVLERHRTGLRTI